MQIKKQHPIYWNEKQKIQKLIGTKINSAVLIKRIPIVLTPNYTSWTIDINQPTFFKRTLTLYIQNTHLCILYIWFLYSFCFSFC